ncbi:MAG: C25 family cysteine peptidase [candidate division WOR-3 bacterium]
MRALLVLSCLAGLAAALVVQERVEFRPGHFTMNERDNYVLILGEDMDFVDEPGRPMLPAVPVRVELPGPARVKAVQVRPGDWAELSEDVVPFPAQPPVILSRFDLSDKMVPPDPGVYSSSVPWPEVSWGWTGTGVYHGKTVAEVVLYPLRYVGSERRLEFCPRFEVTVEFEPLPSRPRLDQAEFEYVIVTAAQYDSIFSRLAAWKTQKGVPAVVRHIDWVYANYPGRDNAERLRNYLATLPDSGVRWVLLGGDVSVIPFRKAFAMVSEGNIHQREDSLPCDLYFSDLDGTWDLDNDNVFGEVADSVDLYPDLFVGRAPVDNLNEARGFVNKVLQYEQAGSGSCQTNVLFFAEIMWQDPYTDGGRHKDRLEARSFPSGYTVTKRYQRLGNLSRSSVMAALRQGQNFANHDGHGWIDVMSCGSSYLRTGDADTITNGYRGVLYSIGCWTTAFDFTSIGEAFVANPNGGTVATIGHSSYGWGSPGNPGFGYSDRFDDRFWFEVLNQRNCRAGAALAHAKSFFVPFSRGENVYRWHQFQTNLMGDPELPIWTRVPESLDVTAPEAIPAGSSRLLVTVTVRGRPVEGALVCLMKGDESYFRARTDASGQAWLAAEPRSPGSFTLTVTAPNFLPWTGQIPVAAGAYVNLARWELNDSLGNNDGIANPEETLFISVTMHNAGDAQSGPMGLVLRTSESAVVLIDSTEGLGSLAPQESVRLANAFRLTLGETPGDGQLLRFGLSVTNGREFYPVILVGRPDLSVERYFWLRPPALPGETKGLKVAVRNSGFGWGHGTVCRLNSLDPNVTVVGPESLHLGEVPPRGLTVPADSFLVSISSGCPGSYLAPVAVVLGSEGNRFSDTVRLLVGNFGFFDDMEAGEEKWTHGGTGDRWHRSTYRAHSGSYSWYCGDEASHRYYDNMNSWLQTVPFMVAENCSLRFWRWFNVPNYGVDGIYVIVLRGSRAETLDFIGTGGALRPGSDFGIESDWFEERYGLSWLPVGETVQVRIGFKSDGDGDRGEGFYIDDLLVTGGGGLAVALDVGAEPAAPQRLLARPNPFRTRTTILLNRSPLTILVYDPGGRLVRTLTPSGTEPATRYVVWDGTDEQGRRLKAGVYFLRMSDPSDRAETGKVLLTR